MRLQKIRAWLDNRSISHKYTEEDGCGSIDFLYKGLSYHIWEFPEEEQGAESNVCSAGKMDVYGSGYEDEILEILKTW